MARRIAPIVLFVIGVLGLTAIARCGGGTWSIGDGALIELYTIHASHGAQLLGAYSQYGWHHPGPLLFYLLAPIYAWGGHSTLALNAGALIVNILSVGVAARVLARRREAAGFAIVFFILALLIFLRVPLLLASAWNPHPPVVAFVALLVLCADCLCGRFRRLPLIVLFASFIVQTHVGYAPVAVALVAVVAIAALLVAATDPGRRRDITISGLVAFALLEVVWLLPVAEQLSGYPGNMTAIWRFFFIGEPGQTPGVAWRAWSSMLAGVFRPSFTLATGRGFTGSSNPLTLVLGSAPVLALVPVIVWAHRQRRFYAAMAALSLLASAIGFWSTLRIHGLIGDYQIFWLSMLGAVNVALATGAWLAGRGERFLRPAAAAMVAGAAAIGTYNLIEQTRQAPLDLPYAAVRSLSEQTLRGMASMGNRRPLVRLDTEQGIGAGLLVALVKASTPFTVDAAVAPLYGPEWTTTGDEDALLTLCGPEEHAQLATRPHNVTLAYFDELPLYVDAVSLVDEPQYRK
jgi:hypothetical protein